MKKIIIFSLVFTLIHFPVPLILANKRSKDTALKIWAIAVLFLTDTAIFMIYTAQFNNRKMIRWLLFIGSVATFFLLGYGLSSIIWNIIIEKGQYFRWVYFYSAIISSLSAISVAAYIQWHLCLFRPPEEERLPRMVLVPLLVIFMFIAVVVSTAKSFQGGVLEQERVLMGWLWVTVGAVTISPLAFLLLRMMVRVASSLYDEDDDESSNCVSRMCVFMGPYTIVFVPFVAFWASRGIYLMVIYYDKIIKNMQNPEYLIFNQVLLFWAIIPFLTLILLYLRADLIAKKAKESLWDSKTGSHLLNADAEASNLSFSV